MRGTKLEWGYLPQTRSFTNKISMVLIATAVGVSAGGLVAFSFVERFVDKKGQTSQVASTPSLRLHAQAVESESAKAAEGGGHAENASSRALAEQRTAADYGPTKSLPVGAETAARAVTLLEASATQRQHVATSETRSRKWLAPGKYYMRVGTAHPRHAHRGWIRSYQNAGWRRDNWD
jgi:hypothetical protein